MKISVITPSYKQLQWLKLCVASVEDQRGVEVEHIIQDAHSGADLEDWVQTHSRARLFVEKDSGMYDAINRGFLKATGDIVAWLNCDEQYLPGALAKVAAFFEKHPEIDVLFGDAVLLDPEGQILSYRLAVRPTLLHTQLVHLCTLSCAMFVRRPVIQGGLLLDTRYRAISDAVWIAAMLRAKLKMAVIHEPLSAFTLTGSNLGQSPVSREESAQWRGELRHLAFLTLPVILWHRIRKGFAGAYRRRNLEIAVYTQGSSETRVTVRRSNTPSHWPGAAA